MANRKKLIEEIMAGFHCMKNKMQAKAGHKDHSQLYVLAVIEEYHNIGIKEISKKLNISSSAATQLVDALVENGYVTRRESKKDRRALQLAISTKGKKHISELKSKRMKVMAELFGALNDEELENYFRLHKKILSKIN